MMSLRPSLLVDYHHPWQTVLFSCSCYVLYIQPGGDGGGGTSEESFIYILHIVGEALDDVLQVVLCNIDVHYESLAEECLLFRWKM